MPPKLTLYIAASLDGFIAAEQDDLRWLEAFHQADEDYGYAAFLESVDGLVMGANTYRVIQQLGDWPYGETPCWVYSHQPLAAPATGEVHWTQAAPRQLMDTWAQARLRHIWLVGGGELIGQFLQAGLIDELRLFLAPLMLGSGTPLFPHPSVQQLWQLLDQRAYTSGLVELHYRRSVSP